MGTTDSPISSGPLQQVMDPDKKELEEDPSNYPTILLSGGEIIEFGNSVMWVSLVELVCMGRGPHLHTPLCCALFKIGNFAYELVVLT